MALCCSTCRWLAPIKTQAFEVDLSESEMKAFCEAEVSRLAPEAESVSMVGKPPVLFGECRLNPPSPCMVDGNPMVSFPVVGSGDWCSRHEPSMENPSS